MSRKSKKKTFLNLSIATPLDEFLESYLKKRGYGTKTGVIEDALGEWLAKKGYKVEPSQQEIESELRADSGAKERAEKERRKAELAAEIEKLEKELRGTKRP
jgi:Arc/MetJ-type ribon-helix-helix transcriptional regulator